MKYILFVALTVMGASQCVRNVMAETPKTKKEVEKYWTQVGRQQAIHCALRVMDEPTGWKTDNPELELAKSIEKCLAKEVVE